MRRLLFIPLLLLALSGYGQIIRANSFYVAPTVAAPAGGPPSFLGSDGHTWAWYISADLGSITKDGSNLVSEWADTLDSGNDLVQAAGADQPLWSASNISFDGSSDFMATDGGTLGQPITIYMVVLQDSWTDNNKFFHGGGDPSPYCQQRSSSPDINVDAGTGSDASSDLILDTWGLITIVFNGASSVLQVDDHSAITGDFGSQDMDGFALAAYYAGLIQFADIDVKEVIIRDVADDLTARTSVKTYLQTRYGL